MPDEKSLAQIGLALLDAAGSTPIAAPFPIFGATPPQPPPPTPSAPKPKSAEEVEREQRAANREAERRVLGEQQEAAEAMRERVIDSKIKLQGRILGKLASTFAEQIATHGAGDDDDRKKKKKKKKKKR
jgi:hypothetical protein